jgi:predicted RNA-binding Zn ribbon-like protein
MPLLRVQAFVDTVDREAGTDILAHATEARAWLAEAGLLGPGAAPAGPGSGPPAGSGSGPAAGWPDPGDDLRLAREARESLRALIRHNSDGQPLSGEELAPLEAVLREAQPRLEVTAEGQVRLGPASAAGRLADGLLGLLLIVRDAQADGTWERLKLCGNPDCRWAFYDRSHSRRGAWCDMATCGNRLKNRNLRARRAEDRGRNNLPGRQGCSRWSTSA